MILAVDIGNTTVGLCGMDVCNGVYTSLFHVKTDRVTEPDAWQYRLRIMERLEELKVAPSEITACILSSVVPGLIDPLSEACELALGIRPFVFNDYRLSGLQMDVDEPEKVGMDRIADAVWAAEHMPLPAVTVDMGTATTFNVIGKNGHFLGGIIAPGMETSMKSLGDRAAQLSRIRFSTPDHVIGKNTGDCMEIGSVAGTAAMIDGLISRIEQELGESVSVIMTGGLSRYVCPLLTHPNEYDPDMVPKGLVSVLLKHLEKENDS